MKKQTILKPFLLSMLLLALSSEAYASEVTGSLSSTGVTGQQSGGGSSPSSSVVTGTLSSSVVTPGNSQITGTVTGGSSSGGSSSGSGGSGGGSVLGASTASNNPSTGGAVLGASTVSNPSQETTFSRDGSTLMPRISSLAVVTDQEDPVLLALEDGVVLGAQATTDNSGFWNSTWLWSILLLLLLLAIITYSYMRYRERVELRKIK